jgi:hypothetical protein
MSDGVYVSQGKNAALNIAAATIVNQGAGPGLYNTGPKGRVQRVSVITAGSTAGGVFDSATVAGAVTANQLAVIPNTVGTYLVDMPFFAGLAVIPGTGQVLAVSYD